jgi:hypothetical protein
MTGFTLRKDVTVYYIVRNEDQWVRTSIEMAKQHVDNILVVDTGSVDNTLEEVRKTGVRLIEHGPMESWEMFSKVKNLYLDEEVHTPLVLFVDGNEIITNTAYRWFKKALRHIDLSDPSVEPCLSIPQYDVFEIKEINDTTVDIGYYDLVRGRRRLCYKDRIEYRRGFGKSILARTDIENKSILNSYSIHINSAPGMFWHLRYLGQSSLDGDKVLHENGVDVRTVRNGEALEKWSQYPKKWKRCDRREIWGEE